MVELQQAGIFRIEETDEEKRREALGVACPDVLFPYARETVDTLLVKGTFPPFMLAPVSFDALYAEARKRPRGDTGNRLRRTATCGGTASPRHVARTRREHRCATRRWSTDRSVPRARRPARRGAPPSPAPVRTRDGTMAYMDGVAMLMNPAARSRVVR